MILLLISLVYSIGTESKLIITDTKYSWDNAKEACKHLGGRLEEPYLLPGGELILSRLPKQFNHNHPVWTGHFKGYQFMSFRGFAESGTEISATGYDNKGNTQEQCSYVCSNNATMIGVKGNTCYCAYEEYEDKEFNFNSSTIAWYKKYDGIVNVQENTNGCIAVRYNAAEHNLEWTSADCNSKQTVACEKFVSSTERNTFFHEVRRNWSYAATDVCPMHHSILSRITPSNTALFRKLADITQTSWISLFKVITLRNGPSVSPLECGYINFTETRPRLQFADCTDKLQVLCDTGNRNTIDDGNKNSKEEGTSVVIAICSSISVAAIVSIAGFIIYKMRRQKYKSRPILNNESSQSAVYDECSYTDIADVNIPCVKPDQRKGNAGEVPKAKEPGMTSSIPKTNQDLYDVATFKKPHEPKTPLRRLNIYDHTQVNQGDYDTTILVQETPVNKEHVYDHTCFKSHDLQTVPKEQTINISITTETGGYEIAVTNTNN